MGSIIGFTALHNSSEVKREAAIKAQQRALGHFPHLNKKSLLLGDTRIDLWGHDQLDESLHYIDDGSLLALIGSPLGVVSWPDIENNLAEANSPKDFRPDWDGRFILIRISVDGSRWTMWNDWLGSIPVFHAQIKKAQVASTLEPVVVAGAGLTADDLHLPSLVYMFINGHYMSDWTLFKSMKVTAPDAVTEWHEGEYISQRINTITPSQERWETAWDELVDEMHEITRQAISDVLHGRPKWILPLSSGLDSRLIAGVAADIGAEVQTYSWGDPEATDVIYAQQIARALDLPWSRIDLGSNFLAEYTLQWADLFGSSMHFHGMYQMAFLDAISQKSVAPILSGFIGDTLSGDDLVDLVDTHQLGQNCQLYNDWYTHWNINDIESLFLFPTKAALDEIGSACQKQIDIFPGAMFQRLISFGLWNRQRFFTYFQSTLCDYWRGVGTPFVNRDYARFSLSLPRVALDGRRLLKDVYRRHYGLLATIPGTYSQEPLIRTGSYLFKKRLAAAIPKAAWPRAHRGMSFDPLRMDVDCLMSNGKNSLWPIWEAWEELGEIIDLDQVSAMYDAAITSREDIKPLRKLQSVQTLAYRLLDSQD